MKLIIGILSVGLIMLSSGYETKVNYGGATEVFLNEEVAYDTVTQDEFRAMMNKHLSAPITKCLKENDPTIFMTKCYSGVEVEIEGKRIHEYKRKFYKNYPISGTLIYRDCGRKSHLCDYRVWYDRDSVVVKESFVRPWQSAKSYVDDLCKVLEGNKKKQ